MVVMTAVRRVVVWVVVKVFLLVVTSAEKRVALMAAV